jgi:hypothetical protein
MKKFLTCMQSNHSHGGIHMNKNLLMVIVGSLLFALPVQATLPNALLSIKNELAGQRDELDHNGFKYDEQRNEEFVHFDGPRGRSLTKAEAIEAYQEKVSEVLKELIATKVASLKREGVELYGNVSADLDSVEELVAIEFASDDESLHVIDESCKELLGKSMDQVRQDPYLKDLLPELRQCCAEQVSFQFGQAAVGECFSREKKAAFAHAKRPLKEAKVALEAAQQRLNAAQVACDHAQGDAEINQAQAEKKAAEQAKKSAEELVEKSKSELAPLAKKRHVGFFILFANWIAKHLIPDIFHKQEREQAKAEERKKFEDGKEEVAKDYCDGLYACCKIRISHDTALVRIDQLLRADDDAKLKDKALDGLVVIAGKIWQQQAYYPYRWKFNSAFFGTEQRQFRKSNAIRQRQQLPRHVEFEDEHRNVRGDNTRWSMAQAGEYEPVRHNNTADSLLYDEDGRINA